MGSGFEPGEHAYRCCSGRAGHCACTHRAGRMGPHHWTVVRPFSLSLRLSKTYWIVCPQATSTLPKIKACRDWLLAEAADDARRLKEIASSPKGVPKLSRLTIAAR